MQALIQRVLIATSGASIRLGLHFSKCQMTWLVLGENWGDKNNNKI